MLATLTAFAVSLITLADPPERKEPPSGDELARITERGRLLAGYDTATWHASDAVQAKHPKEGSVVRYIARKTDQGWEVAFGRIDNEQARFLVSYEATQGKGPEDFEVKANDPPKPDTGFFKSAATAIDAALKDFVKNFKGEQRPYNVAVLPAKEGQFWVYLFPAPTKLGVWPLGGDVRYVMSPDGTRIVAKRQLHNSIIEKEMPKEAGSNKVAVGYHTHVLDDVPEDTDVFHVLTRKPAVPEIIATRHFVFQVDVNGAIKYLGKAEELLKK
jgi:hypothetical protein